MKTMKKLFALLLALTMVFGLAATGFAADTEPKTHTITVENKNESVSINGEVYTAYKIFDVTYQTVTDGDGKETTMFSYTVAAPFDEWTYTVGTENYQGDEVSHPEDMTSLVKYIEGLEPDSPELFAFADAALAYATEKNATAYTATAASEEAKITVPDNGYYLVTGFAEANDKGDDTDTLVAAVTLTTAKPDASVKPKVDAPSVDKTIESTDETTNSNGTAQEVGSTVNFKLTSKVPNTTGYETYTYIVHDTMTSGLTLNTKDTDFVVKVGDTTLTKLDEAPDPVSDGYTLTFNEEDDSFTIQIFNLADKKYTTGTDIEITYSAVINEYALKTDLEKNTVTLEYSNNPSDEDKTTTTPPDEVYVYDFEIVIDKVASDSDDETNLEDNARLGGAKFVLTKDKDKAEDFYFWNEETNKVEWVEFDETNKTLDDLVKGNKVTVKTTDDKGTARFEGLEEGTYYLVEIEAPAGYNLHKETIEVEIIVEYNEDGTIKESTVDQSKTNVTHTDGNTTDDGDYHVTEVVINKTGTELPSTGGMGTTLFYVVGSLMVLGAAVLLVAKKRSNT